MYKMQAYPMFYTNFFAKVSRSPQAQVEELALFPFDTATHLPEKLEYCLEMCQTCHF